MHGNEKRPADASAADPSTCVMCVYVLVCVYVHRARHLTHQKCLGFCIILAVAVTLLLCKIQLIKGLLEEA